MAVPPSQIHLTHADYGTYGNSITPITQLCKGAAAELYLQELHSTVHDSCEQTRSIRENFSRPSFCTGSVLHSNIPMKFIKRLLRQKKAVKSPDAPASARTTYEKAYAISSQFQRIASRFNDPHYHRAVSARVNRRQDEPTELSSVVPKPPQRAHQSRGAANQSDECIVQTEFVRQPLKVSAHDRLILRTQVETKLLDDYVRRSAVPQRRVPCPPQKRLF